MNVYSCQSLTKFLFSLIILLFLQMPELPEVEASLRMLLETCKGAKIVDMISRETGGGPRSGQFDDIIFAIEDGNDESKFRAAFLNRKLVDASRKGKYLILTLSGAGPQVVLHYGMTGTLLFKDKPVPSYKSFDANKLGTWPPKFCKFELVLDNGMRVAFTDPRRLGRVKLRSDAKNQPPISTLGHDPLNDHPRLNAESFHSSLSRYSCPIKALLLNQDGIFSGIGNYLADEVCYQAKISPDTKSKDLTRSESEALLSSIYRIVETAVDCNDRGVDFPSDWLFHYRWGKGKKEADLMPNGDHIKFMTVGGRTTAVVSNGNAKKKTTKKDAKEAKSTSSTESVKTSGKKTSIKVETSGKTASIKVETSSKKTSVKVDASKASTTVTGDVQSIKSADNNKRKTLSRASKEEEKDKGKDIIPSPAASGSKRKIANTKEGGNINNSSMKNNSKLSVGDDDPPETSKNSKLSGGREGKKRKLK
jgi:formamidopyrimidine-DNA glycosylase